MAKSIFALNRPLTHDELMARRRTLVRLGLAWLAMMQVMMFAWPGYLRQDTYGQDNLDVLDWAIFLLNWASLVLTVPVILYSAWPVWLGVVRAWRARRVTMDVPVAISMTAAFVPSFIATLLGHGEVYFDSVTMFVAFLLTARFFEMRARQSVDYSRHAETLEQLRGPLMQHADHIAMWFVIVQLTIAFIVGGVWWVIDPAYAMPVMVSLLVMSCPCALSLSAPVSLAAANATLAAYPDMSSEQAKTLFAGARRITKQNLYGSVVFHLITTPLAMVGLVTPWLAAIAMFVSSLAVGANAWRLYREPEPATKLQGPDGFART
jgi:cation transport ATPase